GRSRDHQHVNDWTTWRRVIIGTGLPVWSVLARAGEGRDAHVLRIAYVTRPKRAALSRFHWAVAHAGMRPLPIARRALETCRRGGSTEEDGGAVARRAAREAARRAAIVGIGRRCIVILLHQQIAIRRTAVAVDDAYPVILGTYAGALDSRDSRNRIED